MATSSIFFPNLTDPAKIGAIEADILVSQEYTLDSEVTEHPVEDGFPISDHVIRKPIKLSMVIGITQSPVTWLDRLGKEPDKLINAIDAIKQIRQKAQEITIVTPTDIWENMIMTSAPISRTVEEGNLLRIPCEFTQIRKVVVKTTDVPADVVDLAIINSAGETNAEGGAATQTDIGHITDTGEGTGSSGAKNAQVRQTMAAAIDDSIGNPLSPRRWLTYTEER